MHTLLSVLYPPNSYNTLANTFLIQVYLMSEFHKWVILVVLNTHLNSIGRVNLLMAVCCSEHVNNHINTEYFYSHIRSVVKGS